MQCPVCHNLFVVEHIGLQPIACAECLERLPNFMVQQLRYALDDARKELNNETVSQDPLQKQCPTVTSDPLELQLQAEIDDYQGFGEMSADHAFAWGFHDDCGDR